MTGKAALSGKYQAYPEYKDSGVEWLGDIPVHWVCKKLKWEVSAKSGTDEKHEEGVFDLYGANGVIGSTNTVSVLNDSGVVIIGRVGSAGAVTYVQKKSGISDNALIINNYKFDLPRFDYYLFLTTGLDELVSKNAQPLITASNIKDIKICTPDTIEERLKIATFLDHETAKIDTLIDKQQQLIQLLKEKRQAVISHAVTKGLNPNAPMRDSGVEWLGEVPEHWENSKIKFISELTPRKTEVAAYKDSTCSFIPMEKLKKDLLILDEIRNVSEVFDGYTYFRDEDLLVAKVTPCFENQNMVVARGLHNGIGFGSSEIYVLRAQINNLNNFLYYRLQEDVFMEMATSEMTGAGGLRRVPSEFLSNFQLALPPEKERLEIVDFIKDYVSKFDMLMGQAEEAINLMQERRTALISAAVTGKIDVRHHAIKAN